MQVTNYGKSGAGRDLVAVQFGYAKSDQKERPLALISEGIHGDEYTNIVDRLPEVFQDLNDNQGVKQFIDAGGLIYLVPIVNPDGYSNRRRENNRGAELNRDFAIRAAGNNGFTQPETRAIRDFVAEKVKQHSGQLEVSMEYHCCIGGLIHPWAHAPKPLEPAAEKRHVEVGELVQKTFGYRYGTTRDIVGYSATGGSDDYYYETYGRRAFSFEGSFGRENQNLDKHVGMWNEIFANVAKDFATNNPEGKPHLAILGSRAGQVTLAVAVPQEERSQLQLCRGNSCAPGSRLDLRYVKTLNGIAFYVTASPMSVAGSSARLVAQLATNRTWQLELRSR